MGGWEGGWVGSGVFFWSGQNLRLHCSSSSQMRDNDKGWQSIAIFGNQTFLVGENILNTSFVLLQQSIGKYPPSPKKYVNVYLDLHYSIFTDTIIFNTNNKQLDPKLNKLNYLRIWFKSLNKQLHREDSKLVFDIFEFNQN